MQAANKSGVIQSGVIQRKSGGFCCQVPPNPA
ncbi:hypothetical protein HMPREF9696_02004 [Afipia clevelandensis ATCC 49720]|uniref:Uncharacterized protein n=1 Tax=Afipia clevelandensis ATCC 49720 TaxID=883079 RepID=K8NZQ3_9BRAD|nr:hypothetical protein HMPREF9696_02004 [Afipia clevelandensis ATCC 49720]